MTTPDTKIKKFVDMVIRPMWDGGADPTGQIIGLAEIYGEEAVLRVIGQELALRNFKFPNK